MHLDPQNHEPPMKEEDQQDQNNKKKKIPNKIRELRTDISNLK